MSRVPDRATLRREEILEAAERIFAEKGYHPTGIADIATALGLGHGTFYRYFKNKHDIAVHVLDRAIQRFASVGLAEDPEGSDTIEQYRAQTERILSSWVELAETEPHILRFLHEQSRVVDPARLERMLVTYVDYTARFLDNGVQKGFLRADLDLRRTAQMLVALIFEGTRRALDAPDAEARRAWVRAGMALMFQGIA